MARKCKTCGGDCSEFGFGKYKCSWCGHEYSEQDFIKENSNVADLETFSLLNKARLAIELEYDFKKSLKYSQSVLEKNPENQEANWLALLAENQVIYIQNDKGKHVPTFLESDKSCLTRGKYYSALNERYKADAQEVEKVRLAAVEEFKKVKPYDVFISYKQHESDGTSAETKEAVWARDIYTELKTNPKTKHLNTFFDQKCLSGANAGWEPHIYSAIKSSKDTQNKIIFPNSNIMDSLLGQKILGRFIFVGELYNQLPHDYKEESEAIEAEIVIHSNAISDFNEHLERMGITASYLFPDDLERASIQVADKYKKIIDKTLL